MQKGCLAAVHRISLKDRITHIIKAVYRRLYIVFRKFKKFFCDIHYPIHYSWYLKRYTKSYIRYTMMISMIAADTRFIF